MTETVEIDYDRVLKQTESAVLFLIETDADGRRVECWVPKSQLEEDPSDPEELPETGGTFTVPVWLATEKGLV